MAELSEYDKPIQSGIQSNVIEITQFYKDGKIPPMAQMMLEALRNIKICEQKIYEQRYEANLKKAEQWIRK